jgi:predicted regulator of amino acid metabolism with ACT domain
MDIERFRTEKVVLPFGQKFFRDRHIPNTELAKAFGVESMTIGNWLKSLTDKPELLALIKDIREWEKEHGKLFNH